jgi:hypothetical protein
MEKAIRNAFQLAEQLRDVEVEARIKGPIVRIDTAKRLLREFGMMDGVEYEEQRNKATSGAQTVVYRCINGEDIVCKSKIKSFKVYNEWATIVVSTEVDLYTNEMLAERHFVRTTKTRYSKELYYGAFRLDVTHLHDDDTFQVEVEVLQYGVWEEFAQCIREIVGILQDSPLYISRKKFDAVRCIVGGEGYFVSSGAENLSRRNVHDTKVGRTPKIYRHVQRYDIRCRSRAYACAIAFQGLLFGSISNHYRHGIGR